MCRQKSPPGECSPSAPRDGAIRIGIISLIVFAIVSRIVLVLGGGQFTQLDEARYLSSREAAALLSRGDSQGAVVKTLSSGDHVGFKVIGIIPAFLERTFGENQKLPAFFFASFSVLAICAIGGVAHRLSGSRVTQLVALAAAVTSGSLFYFSRHLLPYDTALALILSGFYFSLQRKFLPAQAWLAGFLTGAGFIVYYGYWTLGAVTLTLGTCYTGRIRETRSIAATVVRGSVSLLGLLCAVAIPIAIEHVWGKGTLIAGARSLSGTIVVGDFRGLAAPWEYLWYCDRGLLFAYALSAAAIIGWTLTGKIRWCDSRLLRGAWLALTGALIIQLFFISTASFTHTFAVHDRLIRQLSPFLCWILALGFSLWSERSGKSRTTSIAWLTAGLALNAWFTLSPPLRQEFPREFKIRGDRRMEEIEKNEPPSPDFYYRYVNVLHYLFEPEVLRTEPLATVLAAPHFYQYTPYLFEAKTPEDRSRRRATDQRMRLVKMPVLDAQKITGAKYGAVVLRARFIAGRRTFLEPLLSVGPRGNGEIFFVHYLDDDRITFGFFSTGYLAIESSPVKIELGKPYTIMLYSTSMGMPPASAASDSSLQSRALVATDHPAFIIELDGERVFEKAILPKPSAPERIYAGVNAIQSDYVLSQFSGEIDHVTRDGEIPLLGSRHGAVINPGPHAIALELDCHDALVDNAEPIVVAGRPGQAISVFIRKTSESRLKVGLEIWGFGAWESPEVEMSPVGTDHLTLRLGPLFPRVGDPAWKSISREQQIGFKSIADMRWNDKSVLSVPLPPSLELNQPSAILGVNPIGGSLIQPVFNGRIPRYSLQPLP